MDGMLGILCASDTVCRSWCLFNDLMWKGFVWTAVVDVGTSLRNSSRSPALCFQLVLVSKEYG